MDATDQNELRAGELNWDEINLLLNRKVNGNGVELGKFTTRIITVPEGNIVEDKVATSSGSNNAMATFGCFRSLGHADGHILNEAAACPKADFGGL